MAIEDYRSQFDEMTIFHNERGRDDRYEYAKVRSGTDWYFIKHALNETMIDHLKREQQWQEFIQHLHVTHPASKLTSPRIHQVIDERTLLFEWVEAPHLSEQNDLRAWQQVLPRYASMLYDLDQSSEGWTPSSVAGADKGRMELVDYVWGKWLGTNIPRVNRLGEAQQLVDNYKATLQTQFQHGDLTPWQIFDDHGVWNIYDGEFSGTDLPRYNDLAYGYGRLATILKSPASAATLLHMFLDVSKVDRAVFFQQFLPVMTFRAVGMLADAFNDEKVINYIDDAEHLLDMCLEQNLALLTGH